MSESIRVGVCETQPVTAEGLRSLLAGTDEFRFAGAVEQLERAEALLEQTRPRVMVLDKSFGVQLVLEWVAEHRDRWLS